jgi:hypothetical protein
MRETINLIETRFNNKMMFIRLDEKKSLRNDFKNLLIEKEIFFESFISDSSKQNNYSERKDDILAMKARVMRIKTDLFTYL